MKVLRRATAVAWVATTFLGESHAQYKDMKLGTHKDTETGITFTTWTAPLRADGNGHFTFGLVLPADSLKVNATEYIGYLNCQSIEPPYLSGWCGISHGGIMLQSLLLMAWPFDGAVHTSFRWADEYIAPAVFTPHTSAASPALPPPQLTLLRTRVGPDSYELVYRCAHCLAWNTGNGTAGVGTAGLGVGPGGNGTAAGGGEGARVWEVGYAVGRETPRNGACPEDLRFGFHNNGFGVYAITDVGLLVDKGYEGFKARTTVPAPSTTCVGVVEPTETGETGEEGEVTEATQQRLK